MIFIYFIISQTHISLDLIVSSKSCHSFLTSQTDISAGCSLRQGIASKIVLQKQEYIRLIDKNTGCAAAVSDRGEGTVISLVKKVIFSGFF